MTELQASLPVFDFAQVLGPGFHFPTRMSVLLLGAGKLALVSPVPIDDAMASAIGALGEVAFLIAPNLLHHLYLTDAMRRYPGARVIAPGALRAKRPDLHIHLALEEALPEELEEAVEVVLLDGAPAIQEFVFFHRATRTLVVTDLVFHMLRPRGFVAHVVLLVMGVHKRLSPSRAWRALVKDRARFAASVARVLALPFETLVMAHGEIVRENARTRLAEALSGLLPARPVFPAST